MAIIVRSIRVPRTQAGLHSRIEKLKQCRSSGTVPPPSLLQFDDGKYDGLTFSGPLRDTSFRNSTFTGCTFKHVRLQNAVFHKARFVDCTFGDDVDLKLAQFQGATFRRCSFSDTVDLKEADFTGASLTRINLERVQNLSEHRLGAADLSYVKLPENVAKLEGVQSVRDLSASAEKILFGLLASCATVAVLSLLLRHESFFRPSEGIKLPVLQIVVPGRLFYYLTPWLLLIPYSYLLSTLLKLWSGLRGVPAILPNGRYIFREVPSYPSFCAVPFKEHWPEFNAADQDDESGGGIEWERDRHVAGVAWDYRLVLASVWFAVPATLSWLWLRYLAIHDFGGTLIQVSAVAVASFMSLRSYDSMLVLLTRGLYWWRTPAEEPKVDAGRRVVQVFFVTDELGRIAKAEEIGRLVKSETIHKAALPSVTPLERRRRWIVRGAVLTFAAVLAVISILSNHLRGCTVWDARYSKERSFCYWTAASLQHASLDSIVLHGRNLRRAFLSEASMRRADLEDVRAEGALFTGAQLDHASLKDSWLSGAIFWEAHLESANLKEARLAHADLRGAHLQGARLQGANLEGANLTGVNLKDAVLCGVELAGASILPEQLRDAHGVDHLASAPSIDLPVVIPTSALVETERLKGPAYLDRSERLEYGKWAAAEANVEWLVRQVADSVRNHRSLSREWLVGQVRHIDVSMGQGTQREQLEAVASLRRQQPLLGSRISPAAAYMALDHFFDKVKKKARNHCVTVPLRRGSFDAWNAYKPRIPWPAF